MEYDFKCDKCDYEFTFIARMVDRNDPLTEPCPECKEMNAVKRSYSSNSVIGDAELLKADKRMESTGVQQSLERIKKYINPKMRWN